MSFGEAISSVFSKYATFSGRARRSEYWYFVLFNFLVSLVLGIIDIAIGIRILSSIFSLVVFIPGLAVTVRRLHDMGKSGWNILLPLIPSALFALFIVLGIQGVLDDLRMSVDAYRLILILFGVAVLVVEIILIVWLCKDSQPAENQWGPNPKGVQN